ncbi:MULTISPECIES: amidohydrolase family protein [Paenibacillus]|uniref:Amidohydrolase n=1 Tax=Paenibacillus radicis (ex Xue et al. 2023) TaxID=2972489 RepID=A0ABT1YRZ5_9BACL|nr:amidohydrolase family protein [Paenibacillus radicis (ex Xue et al. 2023)]MCR8635144.1 amidohydrolase [Paenibacillus radicis (ex Xue et al. 2023)]
MADFEGAQGKKGIIDCDVHVYPKSSDELRSYMQEPWRSRNLPSGRGGFYENPVHGVRLDAKPPGGGGAGTDPDFLRRQLIEEYGIDHAILLPRAFCNMIPDPDLATALAAAYNDWLADTWLGKYNNDGVFKGSITIAHQDPVAAAKEIDRWAGHPHFVQVMTDSGARAPFGQRQYYPIYEACERNGFPFAIHPGTDGMGINEQPSPGYPTHYIEWHTCLSLSFQAHLVSFITEGVFERFPDFKVVLVEGGVSWLPALMWRLDAEYKGLRYEVPWLTKRPSEYLRNHVRMASQPIERPDNDQHLLQVLDMMDARHILMFSSDYPHWDFDSPKRAFPKLPEDLYNRIFSDTARELYRLR